MKINDIISDIDNLLLNMYDSINKIDKYTEFGMDKDTGKIVCIETDKAEKMLDDIHTKIFSKMDVLREEIDKIISVVKMIHLEREVFEKCLEIGVRTNLRDLIRLENYLEKYPTMQNQRNDELLELMNELLEEKIL